MCTTIYLLITKCETKFGLFSVWDSYKYSWYHLQIHLFLHTFNFSRYLQRFLQSSWSSLSVHENSRSSHPCQHLLSPATILLILEGRFHCKFNLYFPWQLMKLNIVLYVYCKCGYLCCEVPFKTSYHCSIVLLSFFLWFFGSSLNILIQIHYWIYILQIFCHTLGLPFLIVFWEQKFLVLMYSNLCSTKYPFFSTRFLTFCALF